MRKRELMQELTEAKKEIERLNALLTEKDGRLAAFADREGETVKAMALVQSIADEVRDKAEKKAAEVTAEAKLRADEAEAAAKLRADELTAKTKAACEKMLRSAKLEAARYEEALASYNKLVEESVERAIQSNARYAELMQSRRLEPEKVMEEPAEPADVELPDAGGDPARLMRNIYKLQNRDIPAEAEEAGGTPIPGLFGSPAAEKEPDEAPLTTVSELLPDQDSEAEDDIDSMLDRMLEKEG